MKQKKFQNFLLFITLLCPTSSTLIARAQAKFFSQCFSIIVPSNIQKNPELTYYKHKTTPSLVWQKKSPLPFSELILSWNASRPKKGKFVFFINVKHKRWSGWKKLAEWGPNLQKTFSHTRDKIVHIKHVRAELQKKCTGCEYRIKVQSFGGADLRRIRALFVNASNWNDFRPLLPHEQLRSTFIRNMTKQSQWWLNHKRKQDLCSAASLGMVAHYFAHKKKLKQNIKKETVLIADKAYDQSLDIFGNWFFNVAQAFSTTRGKVLYRVERLNNFESLHGYLKKKIPVAVSIRGNPRGCAWPHPNGHFVVAIGWDQKKKCVVCLDPAFDQKDKILRYYHIDDFIEAWGKSRNLCYIPIPDRKFL